MNSRGLNQYADDDDDDLGKWIKVQDINTFSYTKKVGNYLIGDEIGKGAFAVVNDAMHALTNDKVALKITNKTLCLRDNYMRKHLRREGRILQNLNHPNIIQLYEVLETVNSYYLVLELCHCSLMHRIIEKGHLTELQTRFITKQLVSAVHYLHEAFIIHRDIKVENILMMKDDTIKLSDFGVSVCMKSLKKKSLMWSSNEESDDENMLCNTQCGSPAYAAPEVLSKIPYDQSADVWSIGVNVFAMLKGSLPFVVKPFSLETLKIKMMNKEISKFPDDISQECRQLILRCLDPNPSTRITLTTALEYPWLQRIDTKSHTTSTIFNNTANLNQNIIQYMSTHFNYTKSDIIKSLMSNIPNSAYGCYKLLYKKVMLNKITMNNDNNNKKLDENDHLCVSSAQKKRNQFQKSKSEDRSNEIKIQEKITPTISRQSLVNNNEKQHHHHTPITTNKSPHRPAPPIRSPLPSAHIQLLLPHIKGTESRRSAHCTKLPRTDMLVRNQMSANIFLKPSSSEDAWKLRRSRLMKNMSLDMKRFD